MGTSKPQPLSSFPEPSGERLDSWKEIASYLKRDERTVRRWEREGLPVHRHIHKKQASIYAYKGEIDSWWNNGRQRLELTERPRVQKRLTVWLLGSIATAVVLALSVGYGNGFRKARWARNQALPEISRLLDQDKEDRAFRLALEAGPYIPNDPLLARLLRSFTVPVSIQTSSPGAEIYVRTYSATDEGWAFLGRSPLNNARVPWDYLRWRIVKPGFATIEAASEVVPNMSLHFLLDDAGSIPSGMVHVPGGTFQYRSADPVQLEPYWLDKYEVTNRQFKEFIRAGGYRDPGYWKHEFVGERGTLSWESAMGRFRDSTGRPGPSTWELESYPEGQADFPVSGVSWYEAAAYCESAGKNLPTCSMAGRISCSLWSPRSFPFFVF